MSQRTATSSTAEWSPAFKPIAPLVLALVGFLALAGFAIAQDPPGRVGRLSDLRGSVFLAQDDANTGWQPVGINYPVTAGDNVWVSAESRAEIDYGGGQLRLAQEANVHFSQLDERVISAFLANGRASLRLRTLEPGEVAKLDTPNAQVDLLRPGMYRLDTSADIGHTSLVVRDGEAEVRIGDRRIVVRSGQTASIQGSGSGAAMSVRDGIGTDGFDQYAMERDRRLDSGVQAEQYVSSSVPGVADLDLYGRWDTVPTYGAVWYPTDVAHDWTPYQDGSWTHVQPWGWTWVDNAPWGWVPFHYGRWVRIGPRWAWCPGEFERRPVYAPALVAWYGGPAGTSWSVGFGRPTFGWVPLSWGEAYWPHYRHTTDYWRRQNRPVAVNVRQVPERPPHRHTYVNARVPGAVVAAPVDVLTHRRPVGPNRYTVPIQQLASASVTTGPLSVRPERRTAVIDKLPARAPETAGAYASRVRPDLRVPPSSGFGGGRGLETGPSVGGRPGVAAGTPYTGVQPTPTPAVPLPSATISSPQQGSIRPMPQPGSIQPLPQQQGSIQPTPQPGVAGQVYTPGGNRTQAGGQPPNPQTSGVAGQVYGPGGRPQMGIRPADPEPWQPPTVNRTTASQQMQPAQPMPMPQPMSPAVNRPAPPQIAAPQQPMQIAPQQLPPQRGFPIQRAPAPMPAMPMAPAPSSIAPAPSSMAPAGGSIAPAGGSIAAPPQRMVPSQRPGGPQPQMRGPMETLPVQPLAPTR